MFWGRKGYLSGDKGFYDFLYRKFIVRIYVVGFKREEKEVKR